MPGCENCWETFAEFFDYDHRTELSVQIRSVYFCIETCIGENINWKSYNSIIKLSTSYIIVKYIRGGLALERFLPRGVEGADILFPRWKQTHVSKSAGNESGDIEARKEFWMRRHSANFLPSSFLVLFRFLTRWGFWTLQKLDCWIALLTQRVRFFVDHDRRNIWNSYAEMIIRRKVVYIFVLLKNIDHSVRNTKNQRGKNR